VSTQQRQNGYLAGLAVAQLQEQRDRLAAYRVQARFELASMYDRAQDTDNKARKPGDTPGVAPAPATEPKP
jgi:hypothetical protein